MEMQNIGYPSQDKPWLKYYTDEAINAPIPNESLYDYMYKMNKDYLNDIAINYFGTKITYGKLFEEIDKTARAFIAQNVKQGDVCTIVTLSCVPSVLCFYALNKIGAASNYINVLSSQEDMEIYFKDASSDIVLTLDLFAETVIKAAKNTNVKKIIVFSLADWMPSITKLGFSLKMRGLNKEYLKNDIVLTWKDFIQNANGIQEIHYKKSPDSLCCLAHTGGTTGFPKTVEISDRALNILAQQYDKTIVHGRQQVFLSVMIPFVIYGTLTNVHMPLCLGFETVIIPKFDPKEWPDYIKKYRPQHLTAIPPYVAPMPDNKDLENVDLSCLITVGLGGDGLNIALEEKINSFLKQHGSKARVVKGYGLTEVCATLVTCNNYDNKVGSVGFPFPTNNMMIYSNEEERELSYNEIGEICVQSASKMMGYKDNVDAMKELFRIHADGSEWIHTGDLGYIDNDGFLFLVGRMKRIILTTQNGMAYKVYPNIVENIITQNSAVNSVCVVGAKKEDDNVLKAYIVLESSCNENDISLIEKELRETCNRELSEYMRPHYYEFVTELPLTAAGKVDFKKLEAGQK